ncbi:putative Fibronectin type III domain-containing protein-like 4, partial [Homarus americanus]
DLMAAKVMDQSSQLFVNWTAAQGVGNCVVTYRITWRPVSESNGNGTSYTTSLSHTITQLEAWTTYHVCVAATTKTKYNNDTCTNTTTDEDKPGPPVIMSVEPAPSSSLRVSWSAPESPTASSPTILLPGPERGATNHCNPDTTTAPASLHHLQRHRQGCYK